MRWTRICALALVMGAAACSSSEKKGDDGAGQTVDTKVTAAEGGKVAVGGAGLNIPANSLGGDVEVTAETSKPSSSMPDYGSLTGLVYDFGPDGTTFDPPATLELPLDAKVGEGQEAVVAWLDEAKNAWVDLPTTTSGGKVSAQIAHFTKFVVRLRDAGAGPVDCSFAECGGDIAGEWLITAACMDDGKDAGAGDNPLGPLCASAVYDVSLDASGTATFGADMSFDLTLTGAPSLSIKIPAECLADPMWPFPDCVVFGNEIGGDDQDVTCSGDKTSGCTCTGNDAKSGPISQHKTGTYSVSGNTFTTTIDTDAGTKDEGEASPYCVSGSTLKVKTKDGTILQAKRK